MPKVPPHILWPGFVVALLLMSVVMVTVTVVAATNDPSFAVVEDYYEKGLNWDEHMAQQETNRALGWSARAEVGLPDSAALRPLTVTLTGPDGAPIGGASVEASVFRYTAAHQVETHALTAGELPGVYAAPFAINAEGKWKLMLTVRAGDGLFTDEQTLDLRYE
ncbi:MAG: FixH family protein [Phycisphaerales bacterium]|nr:FixH family protein [Phycisphaerales bacterium]